MRTFVIMLFLIKPMHNGISSYNQATASAQFNARQGHTSVVFDNEMWVIAGNDGSYNSNSLKRRDVWHSSDGASWQLFISHQQRSFSSQTLPPSTVHDSNMWVAGGTGSCGGYCDD